MTRLATSLRGALVMTLFALNLSFWGAIFFVVMFLKILFYPSRELRTRIVLALAEVATLWTVGNRAIIKLLIPGRWELTIPPELKPRGRYLMIANHQTWVDIIVLLEAFQRRIPFPRFFLKSQLIWFPVIGQAAWGLEFPFMKRHSAEYLAAHPEKRGEDLATTKRACERYVDIPVTILNFAEGTRSDARKRAALKSPYRNLLPPRTGGISYVIASLGEQLDGVLDVTIAYPGTEITMWEFACGRVPRIVVEAEIVKLPPEFFSDAIIERGELRSEFKQWLRSAWKEKDERLEELMKPGAQAARLPVSS
jgi:1-acyl-sn-glycerol-3-phosphate acyltransferase